MKSVNVLLTIAAALALSACGSPQNSQSAANESADGIIGGKAVSANSPVGNSVVGLYNIRAHYICTGTLIANNVVLTAAHCVVQPATDIVVIFADKIESADHSDVRPVVHGVFYPTWKGATDGKSKGLNTGDIGVLKFSGSLPQGYSPAQMLTSGANFTDGTHVVMAGYGVTSGITDKGSGTLRYTNMSIYKANLSQTEVLLNQTNGQGICSGDSGGPGLIQGGNGSYMVWGVNSRVGPGCNEAGIVTTVFNYAPWIRQQIQSL